MDEIYAGQPGLGYGAMAKQAAQDIAYRKPTTRENLIARKEMLTTQLENVQKAIDALDENPGVEKVLTLLSQL